MKLGAFLRLTRIEHAIMLCIAVLVGEIIVLGKVPELGFVLLTFLPTFFIEISAFTINDYFDVETDRKNNRLDRPLVSGEAKKAEVLAITIISSLVGVASAWYINPTCFAIALVFCLLSPLYSYKLKDIALVGNTYVATTMAIPFIFGNFAVSTAVSQASLILALVAFVTGLGREIMGTVRDFEGDRMRGARTLPMIVGKQMALLYSSILYFAAAVLSIIPFTVIPAYKNDFNYIVLVGACDAVLIYVAARAPVNPEFLGSARTLTLVAIGFGLLAFLLGAYY